MTPSPATATGASADIDERVQLARRRDEAHQNDWALRQAHRRSLVWERRLERQMRECTERQEAAKRSIEAELRAEHWGHDLPRPLAWLQTDGDR